MKIVLSFDVPESPKDISFVDVERLVSSLEVCTLKALIEEKNYVAKSLEVERKRELAQAYDVAIDSTVVRCWTHAQK